MYVPDRRDRRERRERLRRPLERFPRPRPNSDSLMSRRFRAMVVCGLDRYLKLFHIIPSFPLHLVLPLHEFEAL